MRSHRIRLGSGTAPAEEGVWVMESAPSAQRRRERGEKQEVGRRKRLPHLCRQTGRVLIQTMGGDDLRLERDFALDVEAYHSLKQRHGGSLRDQEPGEQFRDAIFPGNKLRGALRPVTRDACEGYGTALGVESRSEEHTSELHSPCNLVCR